MTLFMVELAVSDVARAARFYRDALGLPVLMRDAATEFTLLDAGACRVALTPGEPRPGGATLVLEVADLDAEVARLAALGIEAGGVTASAEGYRRAVVTDPDGYRVALFAWVTDAADSELR